MSEKKRGTISNEELAFISNNYEIMSVDDIAAKIRRSNDFVKKTIAQLPARQQMTEATDEISKLHISPLWREVKRTLMPNEWETFESQWVLFTKEFGSQGDLLAVDQLMIKDLIFYDILATRSGAEIVNCKIQIDECQKAVDKEQQKPEAVRDMRLVANLNQQIQSLRGALKPLTDAHIQYQTRKDSKLDDLKATRKARFKEIQESGVDIFSLLKQLDEVRNRHKEGILAEKVRIAAEQVKKQWGQYIEYDDHTLDMPFLSPESVLENIDDTIQNGQEKTN